LHFVAQQESTGVALKKGPLLGKKKPATLNSFFQVVAHAWTYRRFGNNTPLMGLSPGRPVIIKFCQSATAVPSRIAATPQGTTRWRQRPGWHFAVLVLSAAVLVLGDRTGNGTNVEPLSIDDERVRVRVTGF
ncbi:MAG: hypothetical protein KDA62_23060, partial [Planctomycetales bacterium]|nr:hypothetical protein [Planctomycetales bacterium]